MSVVDRINEIGFSKEGLDNFLEFSAVKFGKYNGGDIQNMVEATEKGFKYFVKPVKKYRKNSLHEMVGVDHKFSLEEREMIEFFARKKAFC